MIRKTVVSSFFLAALSLTAASHAQVTIEALDVRGTGIFGHDANVSGATLNGGAFPGTLAADPLDFELTYGNLDIDGDSTANDSVTFTLRASGGAGQRAWGQGIDTGFGSLNGVTLSMLSVSGTTTDSGNAIVFDGFTGAAIGVGGNGDLNRTAEINGMLASVMSPSTGSFQFVIDALDFAPTPTVLFDNSGGDFGAVSARHYDLQFSAVPEPASFAGLLLGLIGVFALRRRA
ncbi:MAG: PEP-CTERM sorting domain-containing protein [Planctomycetota bacterium]